MLSLIRIGLFALCALFLCMSNLSLAQTRPEALPPLDSMSFVQMQEIAATLAGQSQQIAATAKQMESEAQNRWVLADTAFMAAKKDTMLTKAVLDSLAAVQKAANSVYKKSARLSQRAEKAVQASLSLPEMDSINLRKNLPKAWKQVCQVYDDLYPPAPVEKPSKEATAAEETRKNEKGKNKPAEQNGAKKYNPAEDVMLHPPVPPCVIASSSRDEFSGEITREMAPAELFRYTNPQLKTYLQGKTHIICEAALVSTGTRGTLLLTFRINDPNARKAFGRLEKNSVATLKFIDGSVFELQNALADDGIFSPDNDASIFRAQYPLNPEALRKIRRTELDKLRILWSKGFDDYDVQQVDLLMRQAECLFK